MAEFTVYDPATGDILYSGSARHIDDQAEPGLAVVAGRGDALTQRVVDGKIRLRRKRDREARLRARAMRKLRSRRAVLLREMGQRLNPVAWASLSLREQKEWRAYRQALLDLPATVTDLDNIAWPTPPEL